MNAHRFRALSLAVWLLVGAAGTEGPLAGGMTKKPREFREAIKAQDLADWKKSADLMSKAASQQPDDGALTRIYGTRYEPYVPLYFWGLALYKQQKCKEAVDLWERCLKAGAVQRTEKQDLLLRYLEECRNRRPISS